MEIIASNQRLFLKSSKANFQPCIDALFSVSEPSLSIAFSFLLFLGLLFVAGVSSLLRQLLLVSAPVESARFKQSLQGPENTRFVLLSAVYWRICAYKQRGAFLSNYQEF